MRNTLTFLIGMSCGLLISQPTSPLAEQYYPTIPTVEGILSGKYTPTLSVTTMGGSPMSMTSPYHNKGYVRNNSSNAHTRSQAQMRERQKAIERDIERLVNGPSEAEKKERGHRKYVGVWNDLMAMYNGEPYNLKDAIYKVESFYNPTYMSYEEYTAIIEEAKEFIYTGIEQEGYDRNNDMALKMMLHRYITGRIEIKDQSGNIKSSKPMRYDFDDPMGQKAMENQFVIKLMKTRMGQCHSLPLFYLIMAEELGIDAWLSRSPAHTFIKVKDENGKWFNLELTSGYYTNDHWMMSSGKVSSEAIRQGVYLKPLEKKEVIGLCLGDLIKYYERKFGFDTRLYSQVNNLAMSNKTNITAWLGLSNFMTEYVMREIHRLGIQSSAEIDQHENLKHNYTVMKNIYAKVDEMGYSPLTIEEYKEWIISLTDANKEKPLRP